MELIMKKLKYQLVKCFSFFIIFSFVAMKASNAQPTSSSLTGLQVIELIKKNVKPQWFDTRTDTIITGNGLDTVKGIATCMFVDMNILKRAVASNCNLIITHEPTFYNGNDKVADFLKKDKVLKEKMDYIKEHKLIIFRFHDNSHRNNPDQVMQGLADDLGWKIVNQSPWILEVKREKLSVIAEELKKHFNAEGIRVIGNPDLQINRVALVPGLAPTLQMHLGALQRNDVDAILVGEAREWEDYVYMRDAVEQGKKKAAIFIGHMKSEEPGMKYCARWLQTFIKGVPVTFLKDESFWWTPE
jgi:putative NIF3 family GTP cyclohydrolase 1 type 2